LRNATELCPAIGLDEIIHSLVDSDKISVDWAIVTSPKYFKELCKILSDTSDETLQLFFLWKTIQSYSEYIEDDALLPYKRFSKELRGEVCEANLQSLNEQRTD
jgi:endothelin-converting enzyme